MAASSVFLLCTDLQFEADHPGSDDLLAHLGRGTRGHVQFVGTVHSSPNESIIRLSPSVASSTVETEFQPSNFSNAEEDDRPRSVFEWGSSLSSYNYRRSTSTDIPTRIRTGWKPLWRLARIGLARTEHHFVAPRLSSTTSLHESQHLLWTQGDSTTAIA